MASFIDFENISYCGEEGQRIFSEDIYGLDLRDYGITYLDGVKAKRKIYTGEMGDVWQAYSCPFTPEGEVKLGEDWIEPAAIKVNMEACYSDFWDSFLVEQTEISLRGGIPQTFSNWFFGKLREKMNKEYQEIFWKGDTEYSGTSKQYLKVVDGIEKQLEENSGVTKISGASFTVDNAISQVEAVITAGMAKAAEVDAAMDDYKVFMNYSDVQLLKVALGKVCCANNPSFSNYSLEGGKIYVFGFEVVPTMQSRGTVIFVPAKNLVLGFDTFDSHIEYKLIDMRDTTGDNMFRVLAISNIAVGIAFPELAVYSRP